MGTLNDRDRRARPPLTLVEQMDVQVYRADGWSAAAVDTLLHWRRRARGRQARAQGTALEPVPRFEGPAAREP